MNITMELQILLNFFGGYSANLNCDGILGNLHVHTSAHIIIKLMSVLILLNGSHILQHWNSVDCMNYNMLNLARMHRKGYSSHFVCMYVWTKR